MWFKENKNKLWSTKMWLLFLCYQKSLSSSLCRTRLHKVFWKLPYLPTFHTSLKSGLKIKSNFWKISIPVDCVFNNFVFQFNIFSSLLILLILSVSVQHLTTLRNLISDYIIFQLYNWFLSVIGLPWQHNGTAREQLSVEFIWFSFRINTYNLSCSLHCWDCPIPSSGLLDNCDQYIGAFTAN